MNKIILFLVSVLIFFSCKKQEDTPPYITTHTENWMQDLMGQVNYYGEHRF